MKLILRTARVGLGFMLLFSTLTTLGQTGTAQISKPPVSVGPFTAVDNAGRTTALGSDLVPAYENTNSILFYNPNTSGSGLTLVASTKEDHPTRIGADALAFTSYKWFYMGQNPASPTATALGSIPALGLDQPSNKLQVQGLTEGYHVFKVQGFILPEGADQSAICLPDKEEIYVVYVLPRLKVDITREGGGTTPLQYCETEAATQTKVQMRVATSFETPGVLPAVGSFELKYTWYAVKADAAGNFPTIDATKVDLTGAAKITEVVVPASTTDPNIFAPTIAEIGKYKFFVEVEHTLKSRTYDGADADAVTNRKRAYTLYRGWYAGADQASSPLVIVTPAPGKPHITIEAIQD